MTRTRPYVFELRFTEGYSSWQQQEEYFLNDKYSQGYRLTAVVVMDYCVQHRYYFEKEKEE